MGLNQNASACHFPIKGFVNSLYKDAGKADALKKYLKFLKKLADENRGTTKMDYRALAVVIAPNLIPQIKVNTTADRLKQAEMFKQAAVVFQKLIANADTYQ